MDSSKFIKLNFELQAKAKQELIDYLKSCPDGPCVEIPEDADAMDWGIDCKDWDEDDVFVTGIRLNDDGELEFKAEYCGSDCEYGTDGWDLLFSGNTNKLSIGMETIYAFVFDTIAKKSRGVLDETFTVNNLSEIVHNNKPEDAILFGTNEVRYTINSVEEKEDGCVFLISLAEGETLTSACLEQKLNNVDGDKLVFVYDDVNKIRYRIQNCFRMSEKGNVYSLTPEE